MENKQNNPSNKTSASTQSNVHNSVNSSQSANNSQNTGSSSFTSSSSSSPSSSSQTTNQAGKSTGSSSSSSSMQGRSSQQATTGQGGLNDIQSKLQQFGNTAMQKVNSLSTTQKVIGGSLLALGAGWLAMGSKNKAQIKNKVSSLTSKNKTKKNKGGSPNISPR